MSASVLEPCDSMSRLKADYPSSNAARNDFAAVLDAAQSGRAVTIQRQRGATAAVTDAGRLRAFLAQTVPACAEVIFEDGNAVLVMAGEPFVAEGHTLDEAIADMIVVLREYSEDWFDRLQHAPNHQQRWGLATLVKLSSDQQLAQWLTA